MTYQLFIREHTTQIQVAEKIMSLCPRRAVRPVLGLTMTTRIQLAEKLMIFFPRRLGGYDVKDGNLIFSVTKDINDSSSLLSESSY